MAQITVSLPDELIGQVKRSASSAGYATVSDFVRDVLREKFEGLGYWDRVGLVIDLENNRLLQSIAEKIDAEFQPASDYSLSAKALERGFADDYRENFYHIERNEFSVEDARFVESVFVMYDDLQQSAERIKDENLIEATKFPGYDGNSGGGHLAYARFLTRDANRFSHLKFTTKDLNSHASYVLAMYQDMLDRWNDIKRRQKASYYGQLTADQIKEILGR